ncbi:unnamed protein product [Ceutorhynchus assimilis]|uniref:Uncharacterized protein n=1 Tax=Ceutorhynchus assimilis TaxID=467358 RepID=A0A9N9QQV5_9CUCU|nr:unnamed protein product [Ceutorhynchus assimilis]
MEFAIITTILTCIITVTLTKSAFEDYYLPFPSLDEGQMENEIEYAPLEENEGPNFDWSPPNGELPDEKIALFGDDEEIGGLDLRESWIEHDNNVIGETKRAFDFPRRKKNQVLCRVQRAIHHHIEAGHEFFPKSYTSYSCTPVTGSQLEGSVATSHDVCLVRSNTCTTLHLKRFFLKRNQTNTCWSSIVPIEVGSGCDCLFHYKYRIHL